MVYQQLLTGSKPFFIAVGPLYALEHKHPELELNYCIAGSYQMKISNKLYTVQTGDVVLIGSMVSHEVLSCGQDCRAMTVEAGPMFLKEHFQELSNVQFISPVYGANDCDENVRQFLKRTVPVLSKLAEDYLSGSRSAELTVMSGLHRTHRCFLQKIRKSLL